VSNKKSPEGRREKKCDKHGKRESHFPRIPGFLKQDKIECTFANRNDYSELSACRSPRKDDSAKAPAAHNL
jgi:hypothetical protein